MTWQHANRNTILYVLRHPIYAGAYVYHKQSLERAAYTPTTTVRYLLGRRWPSPTFTHPVPCMALPVVSIMAHSISLRVWASSHGDEISVPHDEARGITAPDVPSTIKGGNEEDTLVGGKLQMYTCKSLGSVG